MTTRIVRKAVNDLKPYLAIELRRLKAVGCEHNLKTTATSCLRLRQFEKTTPDPLPAMLLVHPDLTNLAAAAPCVPAEPGDYRTLSIATKNGKTQRIDEPCRLRVELVQTVLEKVDPAGVGSVRMTSSGVAITCSDVSTLVWLTPCRSAASGAHRPHGLPEPNRPARWLRLVRRRARLYLEGMNVAFELPAAQAEKLRQAAEQLGIRLRNWPAPQ